MSRLAPEEGETGMCMTSWTRTAVEDVGSRQGSRVIDTSPEDLCIPGHRE